MSLSKNLYLHLFVLFSFFLPSIYSQQKEVENEIEEVLSSIETESLSENIADDISLLLEEIRQNPININTAKRDELEQLIFLNEFQITSLIDYRKKYGPFRSIYEIPFVFGFNQEEAEKLSGYICFETNNVLTRKNKNNFLFINKIEYKTGNKINNNLPLKLYNRFLQETTHYKIGMIMENDAYEEIFKSSNKTGFDFYSGFLEYHPKNKWLNQLIAGDYTVSFGQGLNLWGRYSSGKNIVSPHNLRKRNQGFKPYNSANESLYFRGIAASIQHRDIQLNIFYSNKNIDAIINQETDTCFFSSIQQTGNHRTPAELNSEKSIRQEDIGMNTSIRKAWYKGGISLHRTYFSLPLQYKNRIDKQFLPEGKQLNVVSGDLTVFVRNTSFFGEWAMSDNLRQAWLIGSSIRLPFSSDFSVLYRNYDRGFQSLQGLAFGENSENRNEKGTYFGISNHFITKLALNAYADYYRFPWLSYSADAPSYGSEHALLAEYRLSKDIIISVRFKTETKEKSVVIQEEDIITSLEKYRKKSFRTQITYNLSECIQFRNRLETSSYDFVTNHDKGFLLYHDMKYKLPRFYLTLYGRYTIFDAESFETRIYQYENDLRYSFYIPFLNGKGTKYYLMIRYEYKKYIDIYFKTEFTDYNDKENLIVLKGELVWKW